MTSFFTRINIAFLVLYVVVFFPLWLSFFKDSDGRPSLLGIGHVIFAQRHEVQERAKATMLNVLMPESFTGLAVFLTPAKDGTDLNWDLYIDYFQYAASILPAPINADAYAMLGFCYFYQNKIPQSLTAYEKSLSINPVFLWTYYNLAVIHFQAGNYEKVLELAQRLVELNPEHTLRIAALSKIYSDILRGSPALDFAMEIKNTYSDVFRMLVISQYRLKKFSEVVNTVNYAVQSGFGPVEVFGFYASLASGRDEDRGKAEVLLQNVDTHKKNIYLGLDIVPRFL